MTTLFDAIHAAIEGPCSKAADSHGGTVDTAAWAGLIAEAVREWADVNGDAERAARFIRRVAR